MTPTHEDLQVSRYSSSLISFKVLFDFTNSHFSFSSLKFPHLIPGLVFFGSFYLQRMKWELGVHMGSIVLYSLGCSGLLRATIQPDDAG